MNHLAMIIALFFVPTPEYENEDSTAKAKTFYKVLIVTHLGLAIIKFLSLHVTDRIQDKMTVPTILVVILQCALFGEYV